MDYLNSIRRGIAQLIGGSLPPGITASAQPVAEFQLPGQARLVTMPAPVTAPVASAQAAPTFRKAPVDGEGLTAYQNKMRAEARLKIEFGFHEKFDAIHALGLKGNADFSARRKLLADFDRYVATRPLAKAAPAKGNALDDDTGQPLATPPDDEDVGTAKSLAELLLKIFRQIKDAGIGISDDEKVDNEATAHAATLIKAGKSNTAISVIAGRILALQPTHPLTARASAEAKLFRHVRAEKKPVVLAESLSVEQRRAAAAAQLFKNIR
jgi:hypothetical protein